jgi:hypothetical protein
LCRFCLQEPLACRSPVAIPFRWAVVAVTGHRHASCCCTLHPAEEARSGALASTRVGCVRFRKVNQRGKYLVWGGPGDGKGMARPSQCSPRCRGSLRRWAVHAKRRAARVRTNVVCDGGDRRVDGTHSSRR